VAGQHRVAAIETLHGQQVPGATQPFDVPLIHIDLDLRAVRWVGDHSGSHLRGQPAEHFRLCRLGHFQGREVGPARSGGQRLQQVTLAVSGTASLSLVNLTGDQVALG
jgi:hypothetical protein